jgi:hypothetical protein
MDLLKFLNSKLRSVSASKPSKDNSQGKSKNQVVRQHSVSALPQVLNYPVQSNSKFQQSLNSPALANLTSDASNTKHSFNINSKLRAYHEPKDQQQSYEQMYDPQFNPFFTNDVANQNEMILKAQNENYMQTPQILNHLADPMQNQMHALDHQHHPNFDQISHHPIGSNFGPPQLSIPKYTRDDFASNNHLTQKEIQEYKQNANNVSFNAYPCQQPYTLDNDLGQYGVQHLAVPYTPPFIDELHPPPPRAGRRPHSVAAHFNSIPPDTLIEMSKKRSHIASQNKSPHTMATIFHVTNRHAPFMNPREDFKYIDLDIASRQPNGGHNLIPKLQPPPMVMHRNHPHLIKPDNPLFFHDNEYEYQQFLQHHQHHSTPLPANHVAINQVDASDEQTEKQSFNEPVYSNPKLIQNEMQMQSDNPLWPLEKTFDLAASMAKAQRNFLFRLK